MSFFPHGLGSLLVAQGWLVRAGGAKCVVDVDYLQDSGQRGNIGRSQAVRITRAVRMLVMVADDGQYQPQGMQGLANIFPGDGM